MKSNFIHLKLISIASRISFLDQFNILNNINVNSFPKTGGTWICRELSKITGYYHKTGGSLRLHKTINRIHSLKKFSGEVNIFRDPRDTYLSYYFFHTKPIFNNFNKSEIDTFKKIKKKYKVNGFDEEFLIFIKLLDNKKLYPYFSINDFFEKKKRNIIRYEDMMLSPEKTLNKILKFFKMNTVKNIQILDKPKVEENSEENITLFREGKIRGYKNYLNKEHLDYFDIHYRDYMNSLGYKKNHEA